MTDCRRKTFILTVLFVCCFLAMIQPLSYAREGSRTNINPLHRVDVRDLGYPLVNEIPNNSCAITSLITAKNGKIYGGTSGECAYLFLFDPAINKVRHLGRIKDQQAIHHSLVEDKDGNIYVGTGKDMFEEFELSKYGPRPEQTDMMPWDDITKVLGENYSDHVLYEMKLSKGVMGWQYVDIILWNDIKNHFKDYPGGHLYRYNPKASNKTVKLPDMDCELEDLGIPLPNNSIYALTTNPKGDTIYGLTYPDGHFFIYDIAAKKFRDMGAIDEKIIFHGPERRWRSLPRALISDNSGRIYTSGTDGMIVYYCPESDKIFSTNLKVPSDDYHAQSYIDYAVIDYFAKDAAGLIYGGSSDGYLFLLEPQKIELVNLGKLRADRRLRCLTVGKDGKVYMIAGERSASRVCQFYSYDPAKGGFEDLGLLMVDRSPYYYYRGYQFDSITTGLDGTIYAGESERRSHLFLYIP